MQPAAAALAVLAIVAWGRLWGVVAQTEDYVLVKSFGASVEDPQVPASFNYTQIPQAGGTGNNGFLFVTENAAPHFRTLPPLGGNPCNKRTNTTVTASAANCTLATNGGPFDMSTGACMGILVHGGEFLQADYTADFVFFGLTDESEWIIGTIVASTSKKVRILEGLSGFNWLVRNGASVVGPGGEVAPRTAIGVDAAGRLIMLEVDGCETCPVGKQGQTVGQLADLFVSLGALHAINLDGGGSSVAYYKGNIVDRPTCTDYPTPLCERAVTDIVCVL